MKLCPNKSSQEWKDLVEEHGKDKAHVVWDELYGDEPYKESAFEKPYRYYQRRISAMQSDLNTKTPETAAYSKLEQEIAELTAKLNEAEEEQSRELYTDLGKSTLSNIQEFLNKLEADPDYINTEMAQKKMLFAINAITIFNDFENLSDMSKGLFRQLYPHFSKHTLDLINKYATEGFEITQEMVDAQLKDIGTFTASVGALADLANYIARTIGSIIKAAQNSASTLNKELLSEMQAHVNKLTAYGKEHGMSLEQVYDLFITENEEGDDIEIVSIDHKNYQTIVNNPELLAFYEFYAESIVAAEATLPTKNGMRSIPNIHKTNFKRILANLLPSQDITVGELKSNEEVFADVIPFVFGAKMDIADKSRDLIANLLQFCAYSNVYQKLTDALPEVRLLEEQLKVKQLGEQVVTRQYTIASEPNKPVAYDKTNLKKMVSTVIDMQLKGKMSKKQGDLKYAKEYDEEGNLIKYKQVHTSDVADIVLKYNSLLRIGLSPITAIANVFFGDISNFIEGVGNRFYSIKNLHNASLVFFKQINYNPNSEKKSVLYQLLEKLNPLQELDDYNLSEQVKLEKMSPEKLQEYMYGMQKKGELYLQSRTMLAVLMKDGFIKDDGSLTDKGVELLDSKSDDINVTQLSDKIQRLNQMIHGRYSRREAAAVQQSVIYRMVIQFRKWIPSAIETRFNAKQYDNRLGVDIEGRYRTLGRFVFSKDILNNIVKMSKGELSEVDQYNMRKNLIELVLLASTIALYAMLAGGDDEEAKKRRRSPGVKLVMLQLNRIAGDLSFFYSPTNINNLAANAVPLSKTVSDLIQTIEYIPSIFTGDVFKSGELKGTNKFVGSAGKILFLAKPGQDIYKLFSGNPSATSK